MSTEGTALVVVNENPQRISLNESLEPLETQEQADQLAELVRGVADLIDEIKRKFEKSKKLAYDAHKAVVAQEKSDREPLEKWKDKALRVLGAWEDEKKRLAQEEADRQAKLEHEQLIADAGAEADRLDAAGMHEEADQLVTEALDNRPVGIAAPVAKTAGTSTSATYEIRIINPAAVPRKYCVPDLSLIKDAVKKGVTTIPGVSIERTGSKAKVRR